MKKILFVSAHTRARVPCQRFRFEQYIDYLSSQGFEITFSSILDEEDYATFYAEKRYLSKLYIATRGIFRRLKNVLDASQYDVIFIQREAFQLGGPIFEKLFSYSSAKLVFDFDDAIWVPDVSQGNKQFAWLKNSTKTAKIISLCDMVFAGNRYLNDYALQFNANVKIIPTTIDTNQYQRVNSPRTDDRICIGWSGSITTIKHFEIAIPFLKLIKAKYGERVYFKVIGSGIFENKELGIRGIAWDRESELEELCSFDIGMMPLPDDEWSKGKCGLKGLQFMALSIPTVMSPVGVNSEIIQDGINGFLASSTDEWVEKLSLLIDDVELRRRFGAIGRQTVVEKYSVESQKGNYTKFLNEVLQLVREPKSKRFSFEKPMEPEGQA